MQNTSDRYQDAVPPVVTTQGSRITGNPHGDDFSIKGPISTLAGNGQRVHINNTGSSNNHGHPIGGNGVGAGTGTPGGHHQLVPSDTSEDDSGGAITPGNPQRDDMSGSGAKMG